MTTSEFGFLFIHIFFKSTGSSGTVDRLFRTARPYGKSKNYRTPIYKETGNNVGLATSSGFYFLNFAIRFYNRSFLNTRLISEVRRINSKSDRWNIELQITITFSRLRLWNGDRETRIGIKGKEGEENRSFLSDICYGKRPLYRT